ncbi:hypothetical protein MNEG_9987 [Monoraphidium neglectum]|uniref:Uncharacterized protein n=1 Tax=Monoraphidium neglectum TaxID=145388 RepID=A0A0D2JEI1_9CHLO|nr:hypothetical protein MNEG_9987 [Monoraphidium neglectum]KIY97977.1 hypothetical protein MNEG_9987 [Monoraphidium neglectum]|eukprot:XP_013896997.1 hypothetical protein MNEG_9987 [Monoraphidium neglectum]
MRERGPSSLLLSVPAAAQQGGWPSPQAPQPLQQPLQLQAQPLGEEEGENSYMAALKSAAADRERGLSSVRGFGGGGAAFGAGVGALQTPSAPGRAAAAAAAAPASAIGAPPAAAAAAAAAAAGAAAPAEAGEQLLRARLRASYESGLVVPLPFLSAAHAAPLALFNAPHSPHVTPHGLAGGARGIDPEAYRAVAALLSGDAAGGGGGAGSPGRRRREAAGRLPPGVVRKLLLNPALQNLARCLAYHTSCLEALPLDRPAALETVGVVEEMAAALRTVLCPAL